MEGYNILVEKFQSLLAEKFINGIRIDYGLELRKFKKLYQESYGEELDESDNEIKKLIRRIGVEFGGRVYSPVSMLDNVKKEELFDYIQKAFSSGKPILYYDSIYYNFEEEFYGSRIYNAEILKAYLKYFNDGNYCIEQEYVTSDSSIQVDLVDEVRKCFKESEGVISYEVLKEKILHIPLEKVKAILANNSEFVRVAKEQYIHIDSVHLDENDLDNISRLISRGINSDGFIPGNELVASIKNIYPEIVENNTALENYPVGFRDVIKYYFSERFSFKGNIISSKDKPLAMADVFADFCRNRESFSLDELSLLSREFESIIYFDSVYDNSLRISKELFISVDEAKFDVAAVDRAISKFCPGDYIAIGAISQFALFPGIDFSWNEFLLEHYVYMYSKEFKLLHAASFNLTKSVGAIVRNKSRFKNFNELITDVILKADIELNTKSVLDFLVEKGYLGKRKYSDIEKVIANVQILRSRKE